MHQASSRRAFIQSVGFGAATWGLHGSLHGQSPSTPVTEHPTSATDTTYPSLEEMVTDNRIEAVFVATDAPGYARHTLACLRREKHVMCAVPATFDLPGRC